MSMPQVCRANCMGCNPIRQIALLFGICCGCLSRPAFARTDGTIHDERPTRKLPAGVASELGKLQDFSFSYSQPGFYALIEQIKSSGFSTERESPLVIDRWTDLLERSADYRGRLITITGVIGRNSPWQLIDERYCDIGPVWELQLRSPQHPILCKCILLGDASDLPLGASVTVTGRFVMIQQYYGESKRLGHAALMIGIGPSVVIQSASAKPTVESNTPSPAFLVTVGGGLLVAFVIVRRAARPRATPLEAHRSPHPAPFSLADDLARWAGTDDHARHNETTAERK